MLFFLSGLQDTDERHDDADNRMKGDCVEKKFTHELPMKTNKAHKIRLYDRFEKGSNPVTLILGDIHPDFG